MNHGQIDGFHRFPPGSHGPHTPWDGSSPSTAIVAQLAEHLVVVQDVAGSSPVGALLSPTMTYESCFGSSTTQAHPHSGHRPPAAAVLS